MSDQAGQASFQKNCAVCHKMFGEGGAIGPDLTGVARVDLDFLLLNIVNPSAFIRPEFAAFEITSKQDQVLTGLVVESNAAAVTLVDRNNIRTVLQRSEIREMKESQVSLMPEGLLEALPPQEVIDLFTYLQSDGK